VIVAPAHNARATNTADGNNYACGVRNNTVAFNNNLSTGGTEFTTHSRFPLPLFATKFESELSARNVVGLEKKEKKRFDFDFMRSE
jgi:hypothetical protein